MSLVNNSANNFKDFLDAIKPYLNYQFYDLSGQGVEANNFSTDEKVIGTWIDGKPLYQKVFEKTLSNVNYDTNYDFDISGLSIDGIAKIDVLSSYSDLWEFESACWMQSNSVLRARQKWTNNGGTVTVRVVIRYTKTNDSAVASGEKIVGQWIDGKPVYQKVVTGNTKTEVGWKTYDTGIGAGVIDKVVSMNGCVAYSNGWTSSTGSTATGSHIMFDVKPATGEWEVYVGDNGAGFNCPAILILRYTKTT